MWHTSAGDRVLTGAERDVYVLGLGILLDEVDLADEEAEFLFGSDIPKLFKDMPYQQKVVSLHVVTKALLEPDEPALPLRAWNEATIHAVYSALSDIVALEVDYTNDGTYKTDEDRYELRRVIFPALASFSREQLTLARVPHGMPLTHPIGTVWENIVTILSDAVLWDWDYEEDKVTDADPAKVQQLKEQMGIDPEYYAEAPPLDNAAAIAAAEKYLYFLLDGEVL